MKNYKYILHTLTAIILALSTFQCIDLTDDPVMPVWDVELSLPFINRVYTLEDILVRNPDLLTSDVDGTIIFQYVDSLQAQSIGSSLRLHPQPVEFPVGIGPIHVPVPEFMVPVSFDEILDPGVTFNPYPGIEPTHFEPYDQYSFTEIKYAVFESGSITITIENHTGAPASFPEGVRLINSDRSEIAHFQVTNSIENGDTYISTADLTGMVIYSEAVLEFIYESPARNEAITIADDPEILFSFETQDTQASDLTAVIPEQNVEFRNSASLVIDKETVISNATFKQGGFEIVVENKLPAAVSILFSIKEFHKRDDPSQIFEQSIDLPPLKKVISDVELTEWQFTAPGTEAVSSVTVTVEINRIGSGGEMATIHSTDTIISGIEIYSPPDDVIIVEEFSGVLHPLEYEIEEFIDVGFENISGDFEGELTFGDIELNLELLLDSDFPAEADLTIVGLRNGVIMDSIAIPDNKRYIEPGILNSIRLNSDNSRLDEFLMSFFPNFPDELGLMGNTIINPDLQTGSISSATALSSIFEFEIPFVIGIRNGLFTDTLSIGADRADINRELIELVNFGRVYFETINHLPLGFSIRMGLLDSRGNLIHLVPREEHPPIIIDPAPVDEEGRVLTPTDPVVQFVEVVRGDIDFFEDAESALVVFTVDTPDDIDQVRMRSIDDVRVKIFANLNVRIDP